VVQAAQRQLFEVTTNVDVSAFDEESFADEMERATGRGTDATMGLVESTLNLLAGLIGIVAVAVALGLLHPLLIVVTVSAMIPTGWAAMHAGQQQYRAYLASSIRRRRLWILARLMADRRPAVELRAYGLRAFLLHQFDVVMGAETRHQLRLAKKVTMTNTIGSMIGGVAALGVYAVLAWLLVSGRIPLAAGATAIVALQSARHSLALASYQVDALYSEGRHFRDFETFLIRAETRVTTAQGRTAPGQLRRLELDRVTLAYPERDQPAVSEVSLTLYEGQTIALVGENGSGKTTLAALLCGLRRPDSGRVLWNGEDVSALDIELFRGRIAVITQDHHRWPFTATVNIRLGDTARDAGPEHIEAAARRAAAHDMIVELPRGYDTLLDRTFEGGQDLSGGQWQRLIAARGFFREADLLIMDEPSSALDAKAEDQLFSVVRERRGRLTTILITHRLANVRHADRIYVMEKGRLIAEGTHDELMDHAEPTYRELFELQAAGYAA
jgi:ATP-binding cassette subfamily B protein